jgi:hypothetical protein
MLDDEYHIGFYEGIETAHRQFLMAWGAGAFDDGESNPLALVAKLLVNLRDSAHADVKKLEGGNVW